MSNYPVFERLMAGIAEEQEITEKTEAFRVAQISEAINVATGIDKEFPTDLYLEWKWACMNGDIEMSEDIADILFKLIVTPLLRKSLRKSLAEYGHSLNVEDFEDWISDAMTKILTGKNFDRSRGQFLGWAYGISKYCWIDKLRKCGSYSQQNTVPFDEEILDKWQVKETVFVAYSPDLASNPEAMAILTDNREHMLRSMKTANDKKVLWAVYAGVPWHSTAEIAGMTGLSSAQVSKSKERILRDMRNR